MPSSMMKRLRKGSIKRSFTDGMLRRVRTFHHQKNHNKSGGTATIAEKDDHTNTSSSTCTMDSSSDNFSHHLPEEDSSKGVPTIRWERTASGKMCLEERKQRMKETPTTSCFSSNHILVNRERIQRGIDPLIRCRHLDALATNHAKEMAAQCEQQPTTTSTISTTTMKENVFRGPSIRLIHQMIMFGVSHRERETMLDPKYSRFGMGTATGEDDLIYMSQIFQQRQPANTNDAIAFNNNKQRRFSM